jgi:hypothetical protein
VLSDIEVRRLYIDDFEWERTSDSWKDLIPKRDFNSFNLSDESVDDYYLRLKERFNIPKLVLEQWLYGLYYNVHTVNNYGWIDFDKITITLSECSFDELLTVRAINEFRGHVEEGARYKAYEQLPCIGKDKDYWKEYGTWRTPPIILDVGSLSEVEIPEYADIDAELQLVEGHSRLGYLYAIANCGLTLKESYPIYLMSFNNA